MGPAWEGILVMLHANKKASLSVETHHEKKHTMRSFQYIYFFVIYIKKNYLKLKYRVTGKVSQHRNKTSLLLLKYNLQDYKPINPAKSHLIKSHLIEWSL